MNETGQAGPDRVLDLVAEALEHPSAERAAFVMAACGGDEALRAEVQSLLDQEAGAKEFLSAPAFAREAVNVFGDDQGELKPGDKLGDCVIVRLLGEGGMGEVYLAQDTGLERQVAVKLLKRQLDDQALLRRFRHERKVLAALTHPNIARLYGGALTPEGRAYLVMEYVEGERLDRYCDARGLDVTARLALFRKVCAAVTYAHQNLVVHRDLKPANIRVTPEGEPKLLDFGIAKLLDPENTRGADVTVTMFPALTPEYASPEQLRGEPITTATDVYSLGVVLYELLCGQRPHQLDSRRTHDFARVICDEEPPRPSTVVARDTVHTGVGTPRTGKVPAESGAPVARQRRELEGDLDNIVAKALRKDPARRYVSAAALAEDLRRHSEGLPVSARPDTLGYRAGKFVRRNKTTVAAAALALVALVGGLLTTAWQAHVARQQRDRAVLAQRQAEQLNAFLQTLLASSNPEDGPGRDLKVVQVLDRASDNLDRQLAGEPALRAQAHLTIGQAYAALHEAEPSIRHLRMALAIDQRLYGDEDVVTARAKAALGEALYRLARQDVEAERLLRQALTVERRQPPVEQRMLATLLDESGVLSALDRAGEARGIVTEYLSVVGTTDGPQSLPYAKGLLQLANLSLAHQDYAGAEAPYRQAVAIFRRVHSQTPSFAGVLTSFAYTLMLQGKLDEAEGCLQEAQDLYRRTVGEQNIAYGLNAGCLAWLHFLRGDYPRAEAEMRVAQDIARSSMVPRGEQDYVGGTVVLALAMTRNGKATGAEPLLRESLALAQTNGLVGNASPDTICAALGECLLDQKRYAEAEPLLLAGYAGRQKGATGQPPPLVDVPARLHDLYTAWNKPEQAARFANNRGPVSAPAR